MWAVALKTLLGKERFEGGSVGLLRGEGLPGTRNRRNEGDRSERMEDEEKGRKEGDAFSPSAPPSCSLFSRLLSRHSRKFSVQVGRNAACAGGMQSERRL
jgi:hypothetical protein